MIELNESPFVDEGHLFRKCPICDCVIGSLHFSGYKRELWFDERLFIPCCECYGLMIYIHEMINYTWEELWDNTILFTIYYKNNHFTKHRIMKKVLDRLIEYGFLNEK